MVIDNALYDIEQYLIAPAYFSDPNHPELPYVGLNRWDHAALARLHGRGVHAHGQEPRGV